MTSIPSFEEYFYLDKTRECTQDNNHSLGKRWQFVGSFDGLKLTSNIGLMSFCQLKPLPNVGQTITCYLGRWLFDIYCEMFHSEENLHKSLWKILH